MQRLRACAGWYVGVCTGWGFQESIVTVLVHGQCGNAGYAGESVTFVPLSTGAAFALAPACCTRNLSSVKVGRSSPPRTWEM